MTLYQNINYQWYWYCINLYQNAVYIYIYIKTFIYAPFDNHKAWQHCEISGCIWHSRGLPCHMKYTGRYPLWINPTMALPITNATIYSKVITDHVLALLTRLPVRIAASGYDFWLARGCASSQSRAMLENCSKSKAIQKRSMLVTLNSDLCIQQRHSGHTRSGPCITKDIPQANQILQQIVRDEWFFIELI